ncbi:hypothetical protein PYCCODRAFT_475664 [Trametes coccinea BRFM310]|uniref:Uncharacterized protein n=1 Tax=Trametes coccinea (strain BRFM310) TaxID=1353009 RepID=A0A1Y2IKX7_TRAC3|nr:hypothetical protein PYCCODRAFT_475664 [Trametes coccinea BRFM310]
MQSGTLARITFRPRRVDFDTLSQESRVSPRSRFFSHRSCVPAQRPQARPGTVACLPWRHCGLTKERSCWGRFRGPLRSTRWPCRSPLPGRPCFPPPSRRQPSMSVVR